MGKFENVVLILIIFLCILFLAVSVYFMLESFGVKIGKTNSKNQTSTSSDGQSDSKNSTTPQNYGTIKGRLLDVENNIFAENIIARLCIFKDSPAIIKETKTDRNGNFYFYEVPESAGYWITFHKNGSLVATSEKISVQKGKTTDVGTISMLAAATIKGNVIDVSGSILSNVDIKLRVSVKTQNETSAFQDIASTTTDENGIFIFKNISPGRYELVFEKDGYASLSHSHIIAQKGEILEMKNVKMFPKR